jgi:MFS family permease
MLSKSLNAGLHELHSLHLKMDKEILEVSLFQFFSSLGRNIIMLALPFYLYYGVGYQLWQICMFFFVWQGTSSLILPFVGSALTHWGLKHSMAFRSIGVSIFWLALGFLLTGNFWTDVLFMIPFFFLRSFAKGISVIAYDIFLTFHMNRESKGKTLAGIQIAIMGAIILAPLAGGFIMKEFGFQWLTYVAILFYIVSGVVLLITPDHRFHVSYTPSKLLRDAFKKTDKAIIVAEFGRVFFDAIIWIVWPIFLLLILTNVMKIGIVIAISSTLSMVATFLIGKRIDKLGIDPKAIRFGSYRSTVLNVLRGVIWDPVVLAIIDALHKINLGTIKVPYTVQLYKWLHKRDTFERAHIRWLIAENTYTIAIGIFTILFYVFSNDIKSVFVAIFALGSLTMLLTQAIAKFKD